jgi:hypothetical protein
MAKSASVVGDIVHAAAVRYRVRGEGNFRTRLYNMGEPNDEVAPMRFNDLEDIYLTPGSGREKTILANFQDQGIQIYFRTIHIDETFNCSKIEMFVKPVAESYPIKSGAR